MLSDELTRLFIEGPSPADKAKGLVRSAGMRRLPVLWKRNRDALMVACGPGRRPWFYWYSERKLKTIPLGERAQLLAIRTMQPTHADKEREIVQKRLAAISEEPPARRHIRRVA